jgi:hypothetical protein
MTFVCFFVKKWTNDKLHNFRLRDEQTVNRSRKIAWDSVFCLKRQCIYLFITEYVYVYINIYVYVYVYIYVYAENGNFLLFAANGKQKQKTEVYFPWSESDGNSHLLFQETCPYMEICNILWSRHLAFLSIISPPSLCKWKMTQKKI